MIRVPVGTTMRLAADVTVDGAPATPATAVLRVRAPAGTTTTPAVVIADGRVSATVVADEAGRWAYRWETTAPAGVAEDVFYVAESLVP